ncbi:MAG: hypothetical protein ACI9EW_000168 [Cellvibrionaceae bacterium]|jgi:hypothetical protein
MLEQAFTFTAGELELNRSGQLSPVQEERLESYREVRGCGRRAALIAFGLTSLGIVILQLFLANESGIDEARPYIWGVAGFFLVIALIFGIVDFFTGQNLTQGKVSVMEGVVETWSKEIGARSSKIGTAYFLRVDYKEFQLSTEPQMEALQDDHAYRFFYVENGRVPIIFSVEPLD